MGKLLICAAMIHTSLIHTLDDTTNHFLGKNSNVNDYLKEISHSLVSHLSLEDFVIYFRHQSKNKLKQVIKANPNDGCFVPAYDYTVKVGTGLVGSSVEQKKAIIVNDTTKNSKYISEDRFRYSEMVVPIIHNNAIVGVLDSENSDKGFYNKDLLHLFGLIAKLISYFLNESKSINKEEIERKHYLLFIKHLKEEQLYLNEDLTAQEIAELINISPAYFSHIINKVSGLSFNSIVNSFRVQHIIELLNQREYQKRTLLSIALSSGFNSKSSFNLNFKKITSKSPSEYIAGLS